MNCIIYIRFKIIIMKRWFILTLLLTLLFTSIFLIDIAYSFTCTSRSGSCLAGEVCLFSMYKQNDTHIGMCGYYSNNLCCDTLSSAGIKNSCASDESTILTLYQSNNSNVGGMGYFNYNLCIKPISSCTLRSSCLAGESCIISQYKANDSHVGICNYYPNNLCCNLPPKWSNNQSSIPSTYSSSTLSVFNITWTDDIAVDKAFIESNFSGSPTNYTMALLTGNVYNYNNTLPAGTFYWKSYANDTSNNWNTSDTWYFTVNKVTQLTTLQLNGTSANKDYLLNQIAEIKAFSNVSTMQTTIYANFTGSLQGIASGTGTVTNYTNTTVLGLGRYLIKANTTGNENYTSATSDSYILTVRVANVIISCEAGGPYSADAAVLVVGNVSDQGGTPLSSSVIVEIRKNGVLQTSQGVTSSSEGKYSAVFGSLAAGTYVANVTTSYEGANGYCNDTFSITSIATCAEKTIGLSGYAFDYSTGQTISSGTVKVTIKETGDGKQESFSNGYWSVGFATCLTSSTKYTAAVQITDSSTGKTSYTQLEFVGR